MLSYNQSLTILHGSLISSTKPATDEDRLASVRQAVLEIVRSCHSKDDMDTAKREIHLFLLVNTDIPWGQDLMENEAFSSLVGLVPKLSPQLYITVVRSHNLWPYLVETVPFLPHSALSPVVELCLAQQVFSPLPAASSAVLTGLAISCVRWARRWGGQEGRGVLIKVLQKFAKETLKDEKVENESKSIYLLNVLMVVKHLIEPSEDESKKLESLYAFKEIPSVVTVEPAFSSEIESLLVIFKTVVSNFSFDSWISLTEVSTVSVLELRQLVPYWSGQFAPSNMQLLVAHMQAECKLLLESSSKLQDLAHIKEVLEIMSGFAQIYDRKVELKMEEMELENIFQQLTISEGWKKQAYVDHLFEQDLEHVLWNEAQLDNLIANHESLGHHVGKLINHLVPCDQALSSKQKELVGKILEEIPVDEVEKTFASFHNQFGLTTKLKRKDFSQRFISTLNRASVDSEKSCVNKEFLILAMEDGESVIRELFEEASNNKGKVDTCAVLVTLLVQACKVQTDTKPFFSNLVTEFILGGKDYVKNSENVFALTTTVLQSEPCFSQDIVELFLKEVWTHFENVQMERTASLAEMVLCILRQKSLMASIENTLKLKAGVLFITLLNNLLDCKESVERTLKLKEVILEIIGLLFKSSCLKAKLINLLRKENISYFTSVDCPTLLDHIHTTFWQKDVKLSPSLLSPAQLSSQLLPCLPQLLQSEWLCLPALLESLCPTAPALATIIDCLVLALETTGPSLAHHMVLALCSLITSTTCQATGAAVLRELFVLLSSVTEDLRGIIWPCLHNTLGKYLCLNMDGRDSLVREVLVMVGMSGRCGDRDIVVRMLQQALL